MRIDSINSVLLRKSTSVLVVCIAVIAKIIQQIYFFDPTLDRASQLVMAKNFLNGNGLTINKLLADGITETFIPVSSWPPGYPVIVAALSFIFHISILNAAIIFDCLSIALIIYFSRQILLTINCKIQWVTIYTFLIGFFIFNFSELPATDLNALAFYLCSFSITLHVIKRSRISNILLITLIIVNIIPLTLKYLYAPLIFIPPLYLTLLGFKMKNDPLRRIGLQLTAGTVFLTIALLAFQRIYTGNSVYLTGAETGFFFSNLKSFYPIIISSFTNLVFDYSILQRSGLATFGQNYFIIWWLNVLLCLLLIVCFIYSLFKKPIRSYSLKDHYTTLGAFASLITITELIYLSIHYQIHSKNQFWTYIQEARYMAFIVLFLQQVYFIHLYDNWKNLKNRFLKFSGYIIGLFLIIEVVHGIYFTIKICTDTKNYFNSPSTEAYVMRSIKNQIQDIKKADPGKTIYFLSTEDIFSYSADLENARCSFVHNFILPIKTIPNSVILIVKDRSQSENAIPEGCYRFNTIGNFDLYQCQ